MKLPFRAVGLDLAVRARDELEGWRFADLGPDEKNLVRCVRPYTMTSTEGICALINAVRYTIKGEIPGAIVECGVWRGGSMAAVARTLAQMNCFDRDLYLFDTFQGMPPPGARDINWAGEDAHDLFRKRNGNGSGSDWCLASEEDVEKVMSGCGYDESKIHLVRGRVEETIPAQAPDTIALLRLDTDWYESTRHELTHLFPRLVRGGVIIIDDYGHWQGARQATDEYLAENKVKIFLSRIDYTERIGVKL